MTYLPQTFAPFSGAWTVKALNPEVSPEAVRESIAEGIAAHVPGEVTLDLLSAGLIDDPFDGENERLQQWIGDVDWQYASTFTWQDDGKDRHDLVAYGLDTVATIALNGQIIARTENYHRSYRWNVTDILRKGVNRIEVTFSSSVRESDAKEHRLGYYPHTEHHAFNQLRKPSYQFGWDWGIDVANAGIWRAIGIDSWSGARIDSVRPLVSVSAEDSGVLRTTVGIERSATRRIASPADESGCDVPIRARVTIDGHDVHAVVNGEIVSGRTTTELTMSVPGIRLWWPVGYGDQLLYDVHVALIDEPDEVWDGRVGFRNVRVDTAADETGRPFQIYVNDVPIHARGYNWVPVDAFMSRADDARYKRLFDDLLQSNSNMVRAWGGSIYESDTFYELADQLGIMVWQDFMLACAAYPEDPGTKTEIEYEAREHITRLSSHPSLVVWNGSNENYVAYADWYGFKQAVRDDDCPPNAYGYGEKGWGNYYYATLFPQLLKELDPTRVYLPSSPMSFTPFTDANRDTDGTMHIWDVWNRADYREYARYTPRFADEFGYQAPPSWSTLTRVVHDDALDPFGRQMLVHQKAASGNYKLARGMRSHLTPGHINDVSYDKDGVRSWLIPTDSWSDVEDWHWACQLQQAQAIRFGVEHMRSLEPVNAGALIWQLNDDWPVVSWSAVDYDGHRKPLWYASRDFFAPHFATIQPRVSDRARRDLSWEGGNPSCDVLALVVDNDTREPWNGRWTVERRTLDGTVLASQILEVTLKPVDHATFSLESAVSRFDDASREIIVATPSNPAFARVIYNGAEVVEQALDPSPLETTAIRDDAGYELAITAHSYVRDLFCMADKVDPNASVDGGMVTLLPGETAHWHVDSRMDCDPKAFVEPKVLRHANELKR